MQEYRWYFPYNEDGELIKADGTPYTAEEQNASLLDTLTIFADLIPSNSSLGLALAKIGGAIGFKAFLNRADEIIDAIKQWVAEGLDVVGDWVDFEDLKQKAIAAAIRGAVEQLNKNLQARYEWMPSISLDDETVEGLTNAIGNWLAEVVNFKLSEGLGREVSPFTSFYPPANIVDELDVFLVDEINTKTQLNISSIVKNPDLATELKDQVQEKFAQAISTKLAEQKARMIDQMATMEIYGTSKQMRMQTIDSIIAEVQDMILQKKVIGFSFDGKQYMQQQYKKMLNRKHQKNYRRLHKEQRTWVLRDEPLPP